MMLDGGALQIIAVGAVADNSVYGIYVVIVIVVLGLVGSRWPRQ
jgi:hypothetical protein